MSDRLAKINADQGLYVLHCGSGYSCLGFDVAERWMQGMIAWLPEAKRPELPMSAKGTAEHYADYERVMAITSQYCAETRTKCPIELTPELIGLEGKRIEVTDTEGNKSRYYVGKSGGWMPCHIEIKLRTSIGGTPAVILPGYKIRVVGSLRR